MITRVMRFFKRAYPYVLRALPMLLYYIKGVMGKKKPKIDTQEEMIERELMDERLQFIQGNEDRNMGMFIQMAAARLDKKEFASEEDLRAEIDQIELPEYNVWHEGAAFYKDKDLKAIILDFYMKSHPDVT